MAREKKKVKAKEPVRLRFKELRNGNKSLYLDIYREGRRSYEFLRLYLVPEVSKVEREQNERVMAAGITKKVTFHVARHTFATTSLTLGADLYTTSKLLGHSDISITQVYARIVNRKKVEAMDLFDGGIF